jgi:HK97 family phage major capsid protein/HK97 family phage prohead protease
MTTAAVQTSAQQRQRLADGTALAPLRRYLSLRAPDAPALDEEARTLALTFSSELPVDRWFGQEVLSHAPGAADLSRLNDGGPLLFNHNMDDVIGVVESATIGADGRGHAVVRFARTARGDEMMGMVQDGILRNVSFMYRVGVYATETDDPGAYADDDIYTATSWEAYEISLVTVPADPTVGVGRAVTSDTRSVHVETRVREPQSSTTPAAAAIIEEVPMKKKHVVREQVAGDHPPGGGAPAATVIHLSPEQIRVAERERQTAIRALGDKWKNTDLAMLLIEGGNSIEGARSAFLEALEKTPQTPAAGARVDMSEKEKRSFSMLRGLQALYSKDWKAAGFEREVSNELSRQLGRDPASGGMFLPSDLPFAPDQTHQRAFAMISGQSRMSPQSRAAYAVGAPTTGGNIVATQLLSDSFIEVLRNAMITPTLGARFLSGLIGNIDIPRQITAAQTSWVGELTAGTESEATFDKVSLRPKNLTSWGIISRMMMLQATPAIEMLARADLVAQMALALDVAALSGTGTGGQPTGIINQSGVLSVVGGANGKTIDFDDIIKLYTAPRVANAAQTSMAFALNSKVIGYLASLKATTGTYLWDPQGGLTAGSPDRIKGKPYGESQQLRSTLTKGTSTGICSELIYGNWLELLIAEWGAMEVAINQYDSTYFKSGDVVLRAIQTADIGVRHGASFSVMSDALTPGF